MLRALVEARIAFLQGRFQNLIGPGANHAAVDIEQPFLAFENASGERFLPIENFHRLLFLLGDQRRHSRVRAASFDDMELTTYDTSVKGEITCGERKPANAVVVDFVANTDKKLKIDGVLKSIEFVPADFKLKP